MRGLRLAAVALLLSSDLQLLTKLQVPDLAHPVAERFAESDIAMGVTPAPDYYA